MASFLTNPALLWAGLAAIAIPILIHILNKRRFKRVDWAAMDFLLRAQKINRRRVRLEELILLLMRCAIMGLLGLLLARPFFSLEQGAGFLGSARHERVIVLDDSISMKARAAGTTPMTEAKKTLTDWVSNLATVHPNDSITLFHASNPERPIYHENLRGDASSRILDDIKKLDAADRPGDLPKTLGEVERMLQTASATQANRIVYVLSDLRLRDWSGANPNSSLTEGLKRISEKAAGCYLVDLGRASQDNLAVEEISTSDKALIAGVPTTFEVRVRNYGSAPATDVKVKFGPVDGLPVDAVIDRIMPGDSGTALFTYTFAPPQEGVEPEPVSLQATLEVEDSLADDNVRYYAARLARGLQVLIVDGDPSANAKESETFFLRKALAPRGRAISGIEATVMDEAEFDSANLAGFQAVLLANIYRLNEPRRKGLEDWVRAGGGLLFALGGQADSESFNVDLFQNGQGLCPAELEEIEGDSTQQKWVFFEPTKANHPVLRPFEGENKALLENVKIFQRWRVKFPEAAEKEGRTNVLMRYTNEAKSPALVESTFGEGRVALLTTALDLDWGNWPIEAASYVITNQELARRLAKSLAGQGSFLAGQVLQYQIDLTKTRPEATLRAPSGASANLRAAAPTNEPQSTNWNIVVEETGTRGFYELQLAGTSGDTASKALFSANIDSAEGDLARADENGLKSALSGAKVRFVQAGAALSDLGANASRVEFWRWILYALLAFLCLELFYGWRIGASR